jgi:hypothetical protein
MDQIQYFQLLHQQEVVVEADTQMVVVTEVQVVAEVLQEDQEIHLQ